MSRRRPHSEPRTPALRRAARSHCSPQCPGERNTTELRPWPWACYNQTCLGSSSSTATSPGRPAVGGPVASPPSTFQASMSLSIIGWLSGTPKSFISIIFQLRRSLKKQRPQEVPLQRGLLALEGHSPGLLSFHCALECKVTELLQEAVDSSRQVAPAACCVCSATAVLRAVIPLYVFHI